MRLLPDMADQARCHVAAFPANGCLPGVPDMRMGFEGLTTRVRHTYCCAMSSLQTLSTQRLLTLRDLEIIEDIERREFIVGGATALALVLAGCGDGESNGATDDGPATRTVEHALGTSEIPTNPQRIVQIGYDSMIAILAELGLADRIVGAFPLFGTESVPEPFADEVGELVFVAGDGLESNLEVVARAQPDLIVGRVSNMETTYEALSEIAPVVAFDGSFSYFDYLDTVASVFQREDEAAALRQRYDERLTDMQGAIEPGRVTITQIPNAETVRVYTGEESWIVETLAVLGAEIIPDAELESDENGRADLSLERLEILTGDTILNIEGTAEQTTLRENFGDTNPIWARLPAVRADQVFPVDFNRFSGIYGVTGYLELLDQFEEIFSSS